MSTEVLERELIPSKPQAQRSSRLNRSVAAGSLGAAVAAGILTVVGAQGKAQAQEVMPPFPDEVNMDPEPYGDSNIAGAKLFPGVGNNVRFTFATHRPGTVGYSSFTSDWRLEGTPEQGSPVTARLLVPPVLRHPGGSNYIELIGPDGQVAHRVESPTWRDDGNGNLVMDQMHSVDGIEADPGDYVEDPIGAIGGIQKGLNPDEVVYVGRIGGANRWNEYDIFRSRLGSLPDGRLDLDAFNQVQRALAAGQTMMQAGVILGGESRRGNEFAIAMAQLSDTLAVEVVQQDQASDYARRAMSFNPQAPGQRIQLDETEDGRLLPEPGNPQPGNPESIEKYGGVLGGVGANIVDENGDANGRRAGWFVLAKEDPMVPGRVVLYTRAFGVMDGQIVAIPITFANGLNIVLDADRDGIPDSTDDCPNRADPEQLDVNQNGIGDACELQACEADPGTASWGGRPVFDFVQCAVIDPQLQAEYPEALIDGTGSALLSNVPLNVETGEDGSRRVTVPETVGAKAMLVHSRSANTPIIPLPEFTFPENKTVRFRLRVDSTTFPDGTPGNVWVHGTDPFGAPVNIDPPLAGSDGVYEVTNAVLGSSACQYAFELLSVEDIPGGEDAGPQQPDAQVPGEDAQVPPDGGEKPDAGTDTDPLDAQVPGNDAQPEAGTDAQPEVGTDEGFPTVCGNTVCEPSTETLATCPEDCAVAGDGICTAPPETHATTPRDCNTAPELNPANPTREDVVVGELVNRRFTATDLDRDSLRFALVSLDGSPIPAGAIIVGARIDINGNFTWRPTEYQVGEFVFYISVTDGYGGSDIGQFIINVMPAADPDLGPQPDPDLGEPDAGIPDPADAGRPDLGNPDLDIGRPDPDLGQQPDPDIGQPVEDSGAKDADTFSWPDTNGPQCLLPGCTTNEDSGGGTDNGSGTDSSKPDVGDPNIPKVKSEGSDGCSVAPTDPEAPRKVGDFFKLALLAAAGFGRRLFRGRKEKTPE